MDCAENIGKSNGLAFEVLQCMKLLESLVLHGPQKRLSPRTEGRKGKQNIRVNRVQELIWSFFGGNRKMF